MGLRHRGRAVSLRLQMTYPIGGAGDERGQRAVLEITDEVSGMAVLDIELDAAGVLALLSNRTAVPVLAGMTTAPERIGKVMQHEAHTLERSAFRDLADAQAGANAWALRDGWHAGEASSMSSTGAWKLTRRRWVEPEVAA